MSDNQVKVLLVGSGGREHAIGQALVKNSNCKLFTLGTNANPGLLKISTFISNDFINPSVITNVAKSCKVDFVFIGPEVPLAQGVADMLWGFYIPCIGPKRIFAALETSKGFARNLMHEFKLNSYCPDYQYFKEYDESEVLKFVAKHNGSIVVKANGLKSGKGVKVCGDDLHTLKDILTYCQQLGKFVLEEKLEGPEFSLLSFCDGTHLVHMPPICDFKRVNEGNKGPNTGGMGCISPPNFLTPEDIKEAELVNERVIKSMSVKYNRDKHGYKGILYGGFMKCEDGLKVIEYNCRFGDPEAINLLALLESDLLTICQHIIKGTLSEDAVVFANKSSICKYLVPLGYPNKPTKNCSLYLDGIDDNIIYAATHKTHYDIKATGSRAIAVVKTGENLHQMALDINEQLSKVPGPFNFRKDIGLNDNTTITYADSGVSIEEGTLTIQKIREHVERTHNEHVLSAFGSFGGIYNCRGNKLVASTDGVGTKSILVLEQFGHEKGLEMLGNDIVNHCVNDILVEGAVPLFFLDYFASSKLSSDHVESFVKGVSDACVNSGCALLGGETAEMPGVYVDGHLDIVGTMIGRIEIPMSGVKEGDCVIGLPSVSPHTNGYSLIRKIIKGHESEFDMDELCRPHRCYLKEVQTVWNNNIIIHGLCHITGGGLIDNPPRVLGKELKIEYNSWTVPDMYQKLQELGNVPEDDMLRTFNMGVGLMIFVKESNKDMVLKLLDDSFDLGVVVKV